MTGSFFNLSKKSIDQLIGMNLPWPHQWNGTGCQLIFDTGLKNNFKACFLGPSDSVETHLPPTSEIRVRILARLLVGMLVGSWTLFHIILI